MGGEVVDALRSDSWKPDKLCCLAVLIGGKQLAFYQFFCNRLGIEAGTELGLEGLRKDKELGATADCPSEASAMDGGTRLIVVVIGEGRVLFPLRKSGFAVGFEEFPNLGNAGLFLGPPVPCGPCRQPRFETNTGRVDSGSPLLWDDSEDDSQLPARSD